jgi:hypothetical protein
VFPYVAEVLVKIASLRVFRTGEGFADLALDSYRSVVGAFQYRRRL